MNSGQSNKRGLIFVISGPSGSGKTSLLSKLLQDKQLRQELVKSVSCTTRAKRSGEKNKQDYFFITEAEFKHKRRLKQLLEWTRYLGYYYATPRGFVEKQLNRGKHVVLCLDLKGASQVKKLYPKHTITIFIMPPSVAALENRIAGRCNKTKKEEINKRLGLAKQEMLGRSKYDYCLVNKNLPQATRALKNIILRKTGI